MNLNYHKMKFLRLAFYVLIAQLVLSGCAGEAVEETSSSSASEINFDAYVGRNASTRLGINDLDSIQSNKRWNSGFGVFARYNHTDPLMDDEHVYWKGDHWGYDHIRFWPSQGSVDFYAFAPWIPSLNLVNKPESNEANPTYIDFPSTKSPVDLLWAVAEKQTKDNISSTGNKVKFQFEHATARLGLDITANKKLEKNGAVITVEEVNLFGHGKDDYVGVFDMEGFLNLKTGKWHVVTDEKTRWYYAWTPTGKVGKDDDEKYDPTKGTVLKLSASQLNDTTHIITNDRNSYIFIVPQTKNEPFYLKITYTVKQGDFEEKVTVRKNLLDVLQPGVSNPSFTFVGGKAYVFHLKLLDPINFSVTADVKDWNVGKDETISL